MASLRRLHNSSYCTKAGFNNCFIIQSKYFQSLNFLFLKIFRILTNLARVAGVRKGRGIACVAIVSSRHSLHQIVQTLLAEKHRAPCRVVAYSYSGSKKNGRGRGRGEKETLFKIVGFAGKRFLLSPPPPLSFLFFCSRPNFSQRTRAETLATQARSIYVLWSRSVVLSLCFSSFFVVWILCLRQECGDIKPTSCFTSDWKQVLEKVETNLLSDETFCDKCWHLYHKTHCFLS